MPRLPVPSEYCTTYHLLTICSPTHEGQGLNHSSSCQFSQYSHAGGWIPSPSLENKQPVAVWIPLIVGPSGCSLTHDHLITVAVDTASGFNHSSGPSDSNTWEDVFYWTATLQRGRREGQKLEPQQNIPAPGPYPFPQGPSPQPHRLPPTEKEPVHPITVDARPPYLGCQGQGQPLCLPQQYFHGLHNAEPSTWTPVKMLRPNHSALNQWGKRFQHENTISKLQWYHFRWKSRACMTVFLMPQVSSPIAMASNKHAAAAWRVGKFAECRCSCLDPWLQNLQL